MESVTLNNGMKMPIVGLGMWLATDEKELTQAINLALETGYRHFDTAWVYRNEAILGKVLQEWISSGKIKREDLFIVTKLPFCAMTPEKVTQYIQLSLDNLKLSYVDLYLVHVPFGVASDSPSAPFTLDDDGQVILDLTTDLESIWAAMEAQVELGKAKSIGVSNFEESQIERIVKSSKIKPANLQVELHAYFQQKDLRRFCSQHGITVCAYSPLGSGGRKEMYDRLGLPFQAPSMMENPAVKSIAEDVGKTPAQVLLRFMTQQGIIVIPKSVNANRLKENFQIMDFKLNPFQMKRLEQLDEGPSGRTVKFDFLPGVRKHPEFPKSMIDNA